MAQQSKVEAAQKEPKETASNERVDPREYLTKAETRVSDTPRKTDPKKRVSFHADAMADSIPYSGSQTRIVVGKANNIKRDVAVFVVGFAFVFWLMSGLNSLGKKPKGQPARMSLKETLNRMATSIIENTRKDSCDLFMDTSTLGSTYTYFAGKDFQTKDVLLQTSLVLPLDETQTVPAYMLMLKHQPGLANVESVPLPNGMFEVKATRPIHVGEEIFVTYDSALHDHAFFHDIPHPKDYEIAQKISMDAASALASKKKIARTKTKKTSHGTVFRLLKKSIRHLNPNVAALIPTDLTQARLFSEVHAHHMLANKTLLALQREGTCVDDVKEATLQRTVTAGQVVATVPLYVIPECKQECQEFHQYCLRQENVSALFCPTSRTSIPISEEPNVEYRWKNKVVVLQFNLNQIVDRAGMIALDIVALSDLTKGEPVRLTSCLVKPLPLTNVMNSCE